jgi:pimeloyl-ACP methyl ester carboxylesterase
MGAAVGVLRAAEDARVTALVSLAGMVHVRAFMERVFGDLALGEPMLGKPHCPWNSNLRDDATRIASVIDAAAAVACPWLLLHGTADELVPLQDARDAHAAARTHVTLHEIEGADHRFAGYEDAMAETVVAWIELVSG